MITSKVTVLELIIDEYLSTSMLPNWRGSPPELTLSSRAGVPGLSRGCRPN